MTFEKYESGVEEYQDVEVIRGPICHTGGVRSYGASDSPVLFIGISPAQDESSRSNRPLTGPSGKMLNACLEAVGLQRKDYYCTNLICTWIDDASKLPTDMTDACKQRLYDEIAVLKPKLIVLLGALVTEWFTGRKFGKVRGAVQWYSNYNCYVMGTYHPSALLRSMGEYGSSKDDKASTMAPDFIRDLLKIPNVVRWPVDAPEAKVNYRVVRSIEQAQNVLNNLPRSAEFPIALDVETTYGKDDEEVEVFKDDLLCVGVGSRNYCWVFTPNALYTELGEPALNWPSDIHWTMHNSIFDSQVMKRKLGVWINICEDTMLQSYSLDERSGIHRLKTLAREFLAADFYEDDRFYGKLPLDKIPRALLYRYNAKDVVYTARLCHLFKQRQLDDNVRAMYQKILIPAVNMYKETQYHGVNIDLDMRLKLAWDWGLKINEEEDKIQDIAKDYGWPTTLNIHSPDQISTFIFKILGLPCNKYTKGGKPSVDKEVIESLREQHEFITLLEALRRRYKMWATYVVALPEKLKVDGRAHPIVKLHGTVTGRPAYSDLAVQTFISPYTKTEYNNLRELVIAPPFEGYEGTDGYVCPDNDSYVIVEVDVGKAEIWAAYSVSQDQQMLADLLSGDYHTTVAMDVKHLDREEVTGDDRTQMKRVTFGIMYDREAPSLSKAIETDTYTAQEYINGWFKRNKTYRKWFEDTQKQIIKTGELQTQTGRKRRIIILGNAHRAVKQSVNFPIQSTSSDVVLDSAIRMHSKIKAIGGHILFTVHDSIVTKALRSRLAEHCKIMHDVLIDKHFDGIVRMPVEVKVGTTWGNVKAIHDCAEAPDHKANSSNNYDFNMGGHCLYDYYHNELGVKFDKGTTQKNN